MAVRPVRCWSRVAARSRNRPCAAAPAGYEEWLVEQSIEELGKLMASGARTSREITNAYLFASRTTTS